MKVLLEFPHNYRSEIVQDLDECKQEILRYPRHVQQKRNYKNFVIHIQPNSDNNGWYATYAFDAHAGYSEANGLYSCPNPDYFCLLAAGDAFVINSINPEDWSEVPACPVLEICQLVEHGIFLFIDFCNIVAWGPSGMKWKTKRLAHDGIQVTDIQSDTLAGTGSCLCDPSAPKYNFEVDLHSGKHIGGWPFRRDEM